jgi:hypothetical protein
MNALLAGLLSKSLHDKPFVNLLCGRWGLGEQRAHFLNAHQSRALQPVWRRSQNLCLCLVEKACNYHAMESAV